MVRGRTDRSVPQGFPATTGGEHMRVRNVVSTVLAVTVGAMGLITLAGTSGASQPARAGKAPEPYYLSLGDSYSIGYQPTLPGSGGSPGYTAVVAKKQKLTLENFGCGGATTASILYGFPVTGVPGSGTASDPTPGCGDPAASSGVSYPGTTQEQAAVAFIGQPANAGKVSLVTISISGNDVTACAGAVPPATPISCVGTAVGTISTNVTTLVTDVRTALDANGDGSARIVGLTYPDVLLGTEVYPTTDLTSPLAGESVLAFDDLINPALSAVYTSVAHGSFVNVTSAPYKKATSGDDSTALVNLSPYGKVSAALWEVCTLTYFCSLGNIHANTKGYKFIGGLIVAKLA